MSFVIYSACVRMHKGICICRSIYADVREQPVEASSLLSPCESQELNLGHQAWEQLPWSTETSQCTGCVLLRKTVLNIHNLLAPDKVRICYPLRHFRLCFMNFLICCSCQNEQKKGNYSLLVGNLPLNTEMNASP